MRTLPEMIRTIDRKRALRYYRAQNAIWLWLGIAALLSLLAWSLDPAAEAERSAIGRQLAGPLDDAWHVVLGAGGALVVLGIWRFQVRAEIVGHLLIAASIGTNAAAVFVAAGLQTTGFILAGVAVASLFRTWFLWRTAAEASPP